ncbi:PREDICTED: uncharacterized protein LOC106752261 [Dinoponera quadriceps]|uniref:Uncharacterized protein LOC106752261 n=1 Tax=Dinoponera quadriceps TaxID=609295 RepID=A0A6P3YDY2_DINQU|nr:PREDICTED: uncharacterized protein LOC106752261 [Dinoponera quadriceps]XP_014489317.1 PREDICTED: uncharacterized protein LOC106752261 [Dinoponera quadriceps]
MGYDWMQGYKILLVSHWITGGTLPSLEAKLYLGTQLRMPKQPGHVVISRSLRGHTPITEVSDNPQLSCSRNLPITSLYPKDLLAKVGKDRESLWRRHQERCCRRPFPGPDQNEFPQSLSLRFEELAMEEVMSRSVHAIPASTHPTVYKSQTHEAPLEVAMSDDHLRDVVVGFELGRTNPSLDIAEEGTCDVTFDRRRPSILPHLHCRNPHEV